MQSVRTMELLHSDNAKLEPITEVGGGALQDKEKALVIEIIRKVNDSFEGELSDQDKLVYVNNVLKAVLLGPGGLYEALLKSDAA